MSRESSKEVSENTEDEVLELARNYLEIGETDYSLLITGAWGSGKTYFWKKRLSLLAKKHDFVPVYVSLYGLSHLDTISFSILCDLYPLLKRKYLSGVIELLRQAASKKFGIDNIAHGKILEDFIQKKQLFLCIDDLERCSFDIGKILGKINEYVEHMGIKTVIICNEDEINKDSSYSKIKEKTVGRTVHYVPNHTAVIKSLISNIKSQDADYAAFLDNNKEEILSVFLKSGSQNLRILKQSLQNFLLVFTAISQKEKRWIKEYGVPSLKFFLALSFEIKKGGLEEKEFQSFLFNKAGFVLMNMMAREQAQQSSNENSEKKLSVDDFVNQYYNGVFDDVFSSQAIYNYCLSGLFSIKAFANEIHAIEQPNVSAEQAEFDRLTTEYWKLSDEEFRSISTKFLDRIRNGEITYRSAYMNLFYVFLHFSDVELIDHSKQELLDIFSQGLDRAVEKGIYKYNQLDELHSRIAFTGKVSDEFVTLRKKLDTIAESEVEKEEKVKIEALLNCMKNDPDMFISMLFNDDQLKTIPIFAHISPDEFFDHLIALGNENIAAFSEFIKYRSGLPLSSRVLGNDRVNLKAIQENIDNYVKTQEKSLSRHLLKSVSKNISLIVV